MEPLLTRYIREPNGYTLDFYAKQRRLRRAEEGARR